MVGVGGKITIAQLSFHFGCSNHFHVSNKVVVALSSPLLPLTANKHIVLVDGSWYCPCAENKHLLLQLALGA